MEIEQLRKELDHLLENVVNHSYHLSVEKQISSLEISVVLSKINKMQEHLSVLKYLLEEQEIQQKINKEDDSVLTQNEEPTNLKTAETLIKQEVNNTLPPSVSEKLQQTLTNKLIDAFTLNDRYLYANELFNKDMNAFSNLIKILDNCEDRQAAHQILLSTKIKFSWEEENEHYVSLTEIISKKFS